MLRAAIALFITILLSPAAHAQKRVALVIGNSAYQQTGKLANPKNDAIDVSAALKGHGFQVVEGFDLDKAAFDRKVREFATALEGAEVGLFFFAGHGLQVAGQNYLVPVDAELTTSAALDFEMVRVDVVHRVMERLTTTNVLFLDACRDNPLTRNLARAMGTRSAEIGKGLAAVESGIGTLISFSTQPGNVALDGTGRNSPFAAALVKHVSSSNDDLSAILIAVRNDVMKETQRKQVPWEHSALTGRFYFNPAAQTARPSPQHGTLKTTADPQVPPLQVLPMPGPGGPIAATAPPNVPTHPQGPFDGEWLLTRVGTGCLPPSATMSLTISRGEVKSSSNGTGSVSPTGDFKLRNPAGGAPTFFSGTFRGKSGDGTFVNVGGGCQGKFTAKKWTDGASVQPLPMPGPGSVVPPPTIAVASPPPAQDRPSLDGVWHIHRKGPTCEFGQDIRFIVVIEGKTIQGLSAGGQKVAGTISASGEISFRHATVDRKNVPDGPTAVYSGSLKKSPGAGTFIIPGGPCRGNFTASRS